MADQPSLPTLEAQAQMHGGLSGRPMEELNQARFRAYFLAIGAVEFLNTVMNDAEEDTDRRIMAAAEILAFAKVP